MSYAERAVALHRAGSNCAQSVLGSCCAQFHLDAETACRLGAFFGGGMRMGETCGAVTGALMALGLQFGGRNNRQSPASRQFLQSFQAQFGSFQCRELLQKGPKSEICPALIRFSAQYVEEHCK